MDTFLIVIRGRHDSFYRVYFYIYINNTQYCMYGVSKIISKSNIANVTFEAFECSIPILTMYINYDEYETAQSPLARTGKF